MESCVCPGIPDLHMVRDREGWSPHQCRGIFHRVIGEEDYSWVAVIEDCSYEITALCFLFLIKPNLTISFWLKTQKDSRRSSVCNFIVLWNSEKRGPELDLNDFNSCTPAVCIYTCTCMWTPDVRPCSVTSRCVFLRRELSWAWSLSIGWLDSKPLGLICFCFLSAGITSERHHTQPFTWVLKDWTPVIMSVWQCFSDVSSPLI